MIITQNTILYQPIGMRVGGCRKRLLVNYLNSSNNEKESFKFMLRSKPLPIMCFIHSLKSLLDEDLAILLSSDFRPSSHKKSVERFTLTSLMIYQHIIGAEAFLRFR